MALLVSALALLLALPPLLSAQGAGQASSSHGGESKTPDACRMEGGWTTQVTFSPSWTAFGVNDTVQVTCRGDPEARQFPAVCTELKDRGPVWDISGVACLRMCNDWAKQVDFEPAQPGFGVGAEVLVTCRQQFQQLSFNVTCRETASGRFEWDFGGHKCVRKCRILKAWDTRLAFAPKGPFYALNELVTLSCPEGYRPSPSVISCIRNGSQPVWSETPTCQGVCTTTAGDWPPSVAADSTQAQFAVGEGAEVTCRPEQYEARSFHMPCVQRAGKATWDTSSVRCVEKCRKPSGAPPLHLEPDKPFYGREESVTLSCPEGFEPSQPELRCISQGSRNVWSGTAACLEKCRAPNAWDSRVQFDRTQQFYSPGDSVTWRCPAGHQPSPPEITCARRGSQAVWSGTATCPGVCARTGGDWPPSVVADSTQTEFAVGEGLWVRCCPEQYEGSSVWMQCTYSAGRAAWDTRHVSCIEKCPRPQGDATLRFEPDRPFYGQNERTKLSCPAGSQPSFPQITCVRWTQGSGSRSAWAAWDRPGTRRRLTETVTCLDACRMEGGWTTQVTFSPSQTAFGVNDTVQVTCRGDPEARQFPAVCTELKDRGPVWDISGVACLRMCNDWAKQVDFEPAQPGFGVGAEVLVTCRQQFQQLSFNVTCRETKPGRFEWDFGDRKCVRGAERDPAGGVAGAVSRMSVLVPVAVAVLVVLAAGALLLGFLCCRRRSASAPRSAKDAGEALYTELQPRDALDIYCTIQTQAHGAAGKDLAPPAPRRTEEL